MSIKRGGDNNDERCPVTLAAMERMLGPDHPDTLQLRNNLAAAHRAADQAD